jgi:CubicO group peptidase (beta-lactamase class C family)
MKQIILLFMLQSIATNIVAQSHGFASIAATIDSIAVSEKRVSGIPGFAVGVIMNNTIVFEKTYGVQSVSTHQPLNDQSDFHMASVAKPFTATAIMQLVRSGKLELDSSLSFFLPSFKMKDARYKQITLRQILNHHSGIPDVTDYEWHKPQTDDSAVERYITRFADMVLDFEPGTKFNYSNAAFDILAAVIARVTGMSFEDYVSKNIFAPAGMKQSSFLLNEISQNRRTSPHIIDDSLRQSVSKVYPYNRIHAPSSTLHSNLEDMLKWADLWLNKGTASGKEIIDANTWEMMLKPEFQVTPEYKVCLSWFEAVIGSKKIYFHSGGDLGYRSFVGFSPETNIAVVLMGNNELFDATQPAFAIFKAILLNTPTDYTKQPIFWELKDHIFKGGIGKVKEVYDQKLKNHPEEYGFGASNVFNLAGWLYDRGHVQQAIDVLLFCTELEPKNATWYEYIGDIYSAQGKKEYAIDWYKKALAADPAKKEIERKMAALKE